MLHKKHSLGLPLFFMVALCLCRAATAPAATVDFSSGSSTYVVGNPDIAGNPTGTGGINSLDTLRNNAEASGNTVNVTGGTVANGIYGGYHSTTTGAAASATGNRVDVGPAFAGNASLFIYGGFARVAASGSSHIGKSAIASGNTVTVSGGSSYQIFGGQAISEAGPAKADNNTVRLTGGVNKEIFGGQAGISGSSKNYEISASGNHIIISGGTVTNSVYGGHTTYGGSGKITNNTVTIQGKPNLAKARILGGYAPLTSTSIDTWSGNTLVMNTSGVTVDYVTNFQNFHFFVPGQADTQAALLTVTGTATIGGSTVRVGMSGDNPSLQAGDTVTLIDAGTLSGTPANDSGLAIQGITRAYGFRITADNSEGKLLATVFRVEEPGDDGDGGDNPLAPQLNSLGESRMAELGLLTQGQDLLEGRAIPQLRRLVPQACGPAAFAVMGGNVLRYNTGSHVDVEGFNLITGLGWNMPLDQGEKGGLLFGVFFEIGQGSYHTYNSFRNAPSIKGSGNAGYRGGGVLARYDTAPLNFSGLSGNLYLEASFRTGQADTHYRSSDFLTASGNDATFHSSAPYYGAHAGLGCIWNITEASSLDVYSKYLWTRQESDSVTIEGDRITFDKVDSQRWRTGARFSHVFEADSGPVFTPYIGAAYEHEFDGRSGAGGVGITFAAHDVRGDTGMGELGLSLAPSATSGLSLDLAVQGYTGKREGGGGSVQFKWEF